MSSTAKSSYSLSPLKDAFSSLLSNGGNGSRDVGLGIPTAATETSPVLGYTPKSSLSSSLKPPPTASESASAVNPRTRPASSSSSYQQRTTRPLSEIIRPESFVSPETEALDRWYEDLQDYERNLESMASASLDAHFKDELQHVDQWFTYLNEAERTATVYTLLQHSSPVQIRFFITVLQQMGKKDPLGSLLSPAYPEKADMQAQLSGAMLKAEFEASQRLMSVLPYHRTPRQQQGQQQQQQRRQTSNTVKGSSNIDRHSFALGEADEHRLFGSLGLSAAGSNAFGLSMEDTAFMSRQSRLKPQARSPMFGSNNAARPRSVIEGDLSSIFGNSGWSFNPSSGGMVGAMDAHRTSTGRPKSADISNWSFGLQSGDPAAAAIGSSWGGLSPTLSTFSERGKTIERPSSASDADQHLNVLGNPWSPKVVLSNNNDDNNAKNFSRRGASIPGTVPETDERQQQVADIVFSMYDDNKPIPQKSTSTHSVNRRKTSRNASPIPTASNSASLAPYWDKSPKTRGGQQYGRFLNPNDIMPEGDHDYLSDHSDASNISNRNHNNHHSRHGNGKKRIFGGQRSSNKEKKYSDVVDMKLLEDIPAWLRNLRLHKYNPIFEKMKWQDMIKLDDEALAAKGVAALGARRKMLKVFEQVKQHCDTNNIPY